MFTCTMKNPLLLVFTLQAAMAMPLAAQDPAYKVKESAESQVHFHATNYGIFGLDVYGNAGGFFSPRGSTSNYLLGSGLWFGARKTVTDTNGQRPLRSLVFLAYNPNSGKSWAYPHEWPSVAIPPDPIPDLYHSTAFDQTTGNYILPTVPPGGPRNWPLWLKSGETTRPMFPGHFEPTDENRSSTTGIYTGPSFMPGVDEQFVSRYHDMSLVRYEMGASEAERRGYPLGLLVEQNIYGWKSGRYSETVVLDHMVINRSTDTLYDCVIGQASDPDLGSAANDHIEFYSSRPELRATRAWTEREVQGAWGQLVMILLEAPVVDGEGFVDNSRRADFRTLGRIGSFPGWTIANDPATESERYDFMTSGQHAQDDGPGDWRAMMASSTFAMLPGDTAHFVIAYAVLHGSFGVARHKGIILEKGTAATDDEALEQFATAVTDDYFGGRFTSSIPSSVSYGSDDSDLSLTIAPNPTQGSTIIGFTLGTPCNVVLRIINSLGETMASYDLGRRDQGLHQATLDCRNIPGGPHMITIDAGGVMSARRLRIVK